MTKSDETLYRSDLIRYRLHELGLTTEQLKKEGFCHDTISKARNGRLGSLRMLFKIADRLGIIRKYLFDFEMKAEPKSFARAISSAKR